MPTKLKNNERFQGASSFRSKPQDFTPSRVFSVILDSNHPKYSGEDSIGTIFYGKVSENIPKEIDLNSLNRAKPLFSFIKYVPLLNEVVLILKTTSRNVYSDVGGDGVFISNYYLPNINIWNNSQQNSLPQENNLKNTPNANSAEEASLGMEQNQSEKNKIPLGEYFTEKDNIKSVQPFEGDMILEGRFGNSIRFGSSNPRGKNNWSENDSEGEPVTIISNGQPQVAGDTILEDINNIDSSIFMLSNQNINNFTPASLNIQSLGTKIAPTPNPQILIVDTPDPPVVISPTPQVVESPDPIIEETVSPISPPTETQITSSVEIDDPIFALLDEAQDEGTLDFVESINDIAGSAPDPGDEDPIAPFNPNLNADWVIENAEVVNKNKRGVELINKSGQIKRIPPPNSSLTVNRQNIRNIEYIFIHTSAGSIKSTPLSLMDFFFRPNTNPNPEVNGYTGRYWDYGGYHWMVEQNGDATRLYNDKEITNGVRDYNYKSIHLNWIGGATGLDITQSQAYTLKNLILNYTAAYPEAKVIGHNQVTNKACPWFYVPKFAENIGVNLSQIDNRDIQGLNLNKATQNANKASNGI